MNTTPTDSSELETTTSVIERGLAGLLQLPAVLARVDSLLETVTNSVRAHSNEIAAWTPVIEEQNRLLNHMSDKQACLERSVQRHAKLTEEHHSIQVIEPMCRQLFPLIDHLRDAVRMEEAAAKNHALLRALQNQLIEHLFIFGITPLESEQGATFDPATMAPVQKRASMDSHQDGKVAEIMKIGFQSKDRLLRHQSVAVYIFKPTSSTTHASLA